MNWFRRKPTTRKPSSYRQSTRSSNLSSMQNDLQSLKASYYEVGIKGEYSYYDPDNLREANQEKKEFIRKYAKGRSSFANDLDLITKIARIVETEEEKVFNGEINEEDALEGKLFEAALCNAFLAKYDSTFSLSKMMIGNCFNNPHLFIKSYF